MIELNGFRVYLDSFMCNRVQYRFPRTRKKRIRMKWAKRAENYRDVPKQEVVRIGNSLVMHPKMFEELSRQLDLRIEPDHRDILRVSPPGGWEETIAGGITRKSVADALYLIPRLRPEGDFFVRPYQGFCFNTTS